MPSIKIISPSGYGKKLWRYLNYCGGKVIGLREYHHILNEHNVMGYPHDIPYSIAHGDHMQKISNDCIEKYFRKPPAKRVNLERIGQPFAFGTSSKYLPFL